MGDVTGGDETLPFVYRVTKYDPADRDEGGQYIGTEDLNTGLAGYYDGAVALELLRGMLREGGAWCRLEVAGALSVYLGWDQYVYVGSNELCGRAADRTAELGLFAERRDASPYDVRFDEAGEQRPADETFWARVKWCVSAGDSLALEEGYLRNAYRRHPLTSANVDEVRAGLAPRALLTVLVSGDESCFTAALPDADGVLRARWRTEPAASDLRWTFLKTVHPGQVRRGLVTSVTDTGVFVELVGAEGIVPDPGEVLEAGQETTVEVIEVDMVRERVILSLAPTPIGGHQRP
ncbi:MAG: hypothetical protein JWQ81_7155 [Amycolatopsis sp.]|uniref:S1 RNA-binding domain-containing protein n=1 Tax=Amycolatopsis sp. TaxID=37632 RepID=UPI00263A3D34|nr:S1 RNA-binding domain-containing protein [Amycolatopsis sp.]MCU1686416.1 hypothetical protein [Amycolatopsis sp.]